MLIYICTPTYLAPDETGGCLRAELDVVVELVEGHVLGDVLREGDAVGLGPGAGESLVVRQVGDLVHVVLVQEDRPRHLGVGRQDHEPAKAKIKWKIL